MGTEIKYKKVSEIMGGDGCNIKFEIPSFQRGYRWDGDNILSLYQDIINNKDGYLLHSLVLSRKDDETYYVIDGQQRLTAIYIILSVINFFAEEEKERQRGIYISYESRKNSSKFLEYLSNFKGEISENISKDTIKNKLEEYCQKLGNTMNLDFEYMIESFCCVYDDLKGKESGSDGETHNVDEKVKDGVRAIKEKIEKAEFIWTELNESKLDKAVDKFTKINMGKIPLTDSELIRAELLNYENLGGQKDGAFKQYLISETWHSIELELHKKDFWAFVPHREQYKDNKNHETRIDYLFEYYLFSKDCDQKEKDDQHFKFVGDYPLYRNFKKNFDGRKKDCKDKQKFLSEFVWGEVQKTYRDIKSLYDNDGRITDYQYGNNLYNLIAYYIYYNEPNNNKAYRKEQDEAYRKKIEFFYKILKNERKCREDLVKTELKELVFGGKDIRSKICELRYDNNKKELLKILLLYNVILLNSSQGVGNRYNFLGHKKQKWSAEHLFPQNFSLCRNKGNKGNKGNKDIGKTEYRNIKNFLPLICYEVKSDGMIDLGESFILKYIYLLFENSNKTSNSNIFSIIKIYFEDDKKYMENISKRQKEIKKNILKYIGKEQREKINQEIFKCIDEKAKDIVQEKIGKDSQNDIGEDIDIKEGIKEYAYIGENKKIQKGIREYISEKIQNIRCKKNQKDIIESIDTKIQSGIREYISEKIQENMYKEIQAGIREYISEKIRKEIYIQFIKKEINKDIEEILKSYIYFFEGLLERVYAILYKA